MIVRITKVDARPTARPVNEALDGNAVFMKLLFPQIDILQHNTKGKMQLARSIMRRDGSVRRNTWFPLSSFLEEKKNLTPFNVEGTEPFLSEESVKSKQLLVEPCRSFQIFNIQRRFENATDRRRHCGFLLRCGG